MLGPTRLSRYLATELLMPTVLGLMLWTFVLLMNHFFYVAERALSKNLGFDLTMQLFLTGLPSILILSIPMSVLLGSLIAMGRISADQEWVALQGAGLGRGRLLRPLLVHGLLASLLGVYVYGELAPRANYLRRDLQGEILFSSNLAADLRPRVFYTELENAVLFVDDIKPGSQGRLDGVILIRHDPRRNNYELILADSGDLYPAEDRSGTLIMDLFHGAIHNYGPDEPETYTWARSFETLREPFHPPDYLKSFLQPPEKVVSDMRLRDLWGEFRLARTERERTLERIAASKTDERSAQADRFLADNRLRVATVELNSRIALPFASLCFAVLALPLGITRARSGKGAGFAVSLLVLLVYWITFTFFRDQAVTGKVPAVLGPWMANLVIVPWALYGLRRMRRPTDSAGPISRLVGIGVRAAAALRSLLSRRRVPDPPTSTDPEPLGELALANVSGTSNRFVFRLDKFIASAYLRMLVLTLTSAMLVYALVELRGLTDGLLRTKQPASLLLSYFKYFAPTVLHILLPISCLVGSVVAFTVLSRTGELTAIKASGISMRRAIMPVIVVTGLLCGLLYLVQDSVAPVAYRKARAIEDQILGRAPKTYGMPAGGRWQFGPEGRRLYHYRIYDKNRTEFQALTVFTLDREAHRVIDHRYARRARWLGGELWELEDSWHRTFEADGSLGTFEVDPGIRRLELDIPEEFANDELSRGLQGGIAEQLSLAEISSEIAELEASGYDTTRLRVAFQGKIARTLSPLVMVLLGLPFAFRVGRRGSLYGIGVALLLVLVYWAVFAIFNALGLETLLEPWAAAWAPNILFGLLGSYLLLYIRT